MSKKPSAGGKIQWTKMFRKLSPYTIRKGFRYMKHYGPKEFWIRLHERFEPEEVPYGPWYRAYIPTEETLETQRKQKFDYSPLISIAVPAYQTPVEFLRQMIESLIVQTYSNWELCIVNASPDNEEMQKVLAEYSAGDSRVRFCNLKENLGIAENTNRAFAMAKGEFVGLLDHDDLLAPNALYEIVKILQDHPQADALYTDEDKVTTELDEHFQPHLKPDFNLDLLRSNNYICHFFVVRKSIVEKTGGFRKEFDGAQDYDFIFRCTENAEKICHIPKVLYHWRCHPNSTASNPENQVIDAMIVPISCTCMSKLNPHAEPPTPATITEMMRVRICLAESRYSLSIARMVPAYSVNCIPSSATMTRPSKRSANRYISSISFTPASLICGARCVR